MERSIHSIIEQVNYEWMKGADNYANETPTKAGWGWYSDIAELSYSLPFHRTMMGVDHTYFVIDLDPEIVKHPDLTLLTSDPVLYRETCIRAMIDFTREFLEENRPNEFFVRLSGSGIHLVQRVPERIDKRRFKTVIRHICKPCKHSLKEDHVCTPMCDGWSFPKRWSTIQHIWKKNPLKWSRFYSHEKTQTLIRVTVDLQMYTSRRKMVRWTYSRNQKIPQQFNYAIPIDFWDADWVLDNMTRHGLNKYPPHKYEIPTFSYYEYLIPEERLDEPTFDETTTSYPAERDLSYTISVPDVGARLTGEQEAKIERMKTLLTGDVPDTPPCIRQHYDNVRTLTGQHWSRVVLVRYLSGNGYSVNDVAMFFRFFINTEKDNALHKRDKLFRATKEAYGSIESPDMVPGCPKMRTHEFFGVVDQSICDVCGRSYPLANYPDTDLMERKRKDVGWGRIQILCRNILLGGESSIITKATRAGVTTSMIAMTKLVGKKMLVVTPTNRIGRKTIPNALRIAKEKLGVDIRGAMFAANKKACLKLVILGERLRHRKREQPNWGDSSTKIAYNDLHYNNRPDCKDCYFRRSLFPTLSYYRDNPNRHPIPILEAKLETDDWNPDTAEEDTNGQCAYITIRECLQEIDVMFMTYSKLAALMQNQTEDAQTIRDAMAHHFDVVLLDEVSYLTNQSPLNVPILKERRGGEYTFNIIRELEDEKDRMEFMLQTGTTNQAIRMIEAFMNSQRPLFDTKQEKYYTERIENKDGAIIRESDREYVGEHFTAFHEIIERAAKEYNIHLENIEDVFHLLNNRYWMRISIPTRFHPQDVSIVAQPDVSLIRRFIRFFNSDGNQVLVTDATLPYISVSEFLDVPLKDTFIGDPRETNSHQMVVTDSRRLSVIDLFFGKKSTQADTYQKQMEDFINDVCDTHGYEDVIIIVPNKWSNHKLREMMRDNRIPPCDMTWYRSDKTIGVECDKRVMVCITAPYPPVGSHDWLAMWYHDQGFFLEGQDRQTVPQLGKNLSLNSAKAAFYQTIGRAKDPECNERSVVYLWGIPGRTFTEYTSHKASGLMTFDDDISLPHITITPKGRNNEMKMRIGRAWKEHGARLKTEEEIRLFSKVVEIGRLCLKDIPRRIHGMTIMSARELITDIMEHRPDLFVVFGIHIEREFVGKKRYFTLTRMNWDAISGEYKLQ